MNLSSKLMMISLVGILVMMFCGSFSEAQINVNDPNYIVRPTDPAPSNIHTNCYNDTIFMMACLHWTDPFAVTAPNSVRLRRPYSRYTVTASSSLGGSLTIPNLIFQEITLNRESAPNLIAPGATVTFRVAGQQIDNAAALSQFSPIPLILIFPTANVTTDITTLNPPYSNPDLDTSNGLGKVRVAYNSTTNTVYATWRLGTRTVAKVRLNLYCFRPNLEDPKINANAGVLGPSATRIDLAWTRKGQVYCKAIVTPTYSNGAMKNFKRLLNFTAV
jgi:hypothetical protein